MHYEEPSYYEQQEPFGCEEQCHYRYEEQHQAQEQHYGEHQDQYHQEGEHEEQKNDQGEQQEHNDAHWLDEFGM